MTIRVITDPEEALQVELEARRDFERRFAGFTGRELSEGESEKWWPHTSRAAAEDERKN
jgi:hypothetical protein